MKEQSFRFSFSVPLFKQSNCLLRKFLASECFPGLFVLNLCHPIADLEASLAEAASIAKARPGPTTPTVTSTKSRTPLRTSLRQSSLQGNSPFQLSLIRQRQTTCVDNRAHTPSLPSNPVSVTYPSLSQLNSAFLLSEDREQSKFDASDLAYSLYQE